jgi:DNA-binding CsgD family transcriptional regulator
MEHYVDVRGARSERTDGEAGMIGAIACWCESLHRCLPLRYALQSITENIGAEALVLARVSKSSSGTAGTIVFDRQERSICGVPLNRSFARSVLGRYFSKAQVGTIWLQSMVEDEPDPALVEFHRRRSLKNLAVIPLATHGKSVDFLEFHFRQYLSAAQQADLNMIASTLTATWRNRVSGLVTENLAQHRTGTVEQLSAASILSCDNPARLSRAEYRVCVLLTRGLSAIRIRRQLEIRNSTLRTHMRNILAKTGTGSKAQLLYKLLTAEPVGASAQIGAAVA